MDCLPIFGKAIHEADNGGESVLTDEARIVEEPFRDEKGKELKAPDVHLEGIALIYLPRQSGPSELLPDV